jgi:hypothetical protein
MRGHGAAGLRRAGLVFACLFSVLAWFFIAGEAMSDPGGLKGAVLVVSWSAPLAALGALAWYRPARGTTVLGDLTLALVVASVWFAADPQGWRSFENGHGPVRAIGLFVLMLPLALLGWRRPHVAGWMLLLVGLLPMILASTARSAGVSSMTAIAVPATIDGILYLLSASPGAAPRRHPRLG